MTLRTVELQVLVPKSLEVSINKHKQDLSTGNETSIYVAQLNQLQKTTKNKVSMPGRLEKGRIKEYKNKQGNKDNKPHKDLKEAEEKENNINKVDTDLGNYVDIRL